jgi:prepilin-type processing-associated H-X9-DG protein
LGAGLSAQTATARHVLAYEHMSNHKNNGMNVLYGDGSVQWLEKAEAERVLSELQQGHNPPRSP